MAKERNQPRYDEGFLHHLQSLGENTYLRPAAVWSGHGEKGMKTVGHFP